MRVSIRRYDNRLWAIRVAADKERAEPSGMTITRELLLAKTRLSGPDGRKGVGEGTI